MVDSFDELYSVSDLHLGGIPGAAVFDSSEQLAALIAWAAQRAQGRRLCFVIGGDIVDFLAFAGARTFNPEKAADWLRSLDDLEAPTHKVFCALRQLTDEPTAQLVLLIGNHDVELALPEVTDVLLDLVTKSPERRSRVITRLDGTGFRCDVGGRRVVCVHGNERDDWNAIDHGALRRWIRDSNVGRRPEPPQPNAGTELVVEVMNPIKRTLPFVDLLKPEDDAVPKVLLSLDAWRRDLGLAEILRRAVTISARRIQSRLRLARGTLGAENQARQSPFESFEDESVDDVEAMDAPHLYQVVERDYEAEVRLLDLVDTKASLGMTRTAAIAMGIAPRANLRATLQETLLRDSSFKVSVPDDTCARLDAWVGRDVDVLIAGHTHLEKHIYPAPNRRHGVYLNTGTWIRLIELKEEFLEPQHFDEFVAALTVQTMAELDNARIDGLPLITRRRTVGVVEHDKTAKVVRVGLRRVRDGARSDERVSDDLFDMAASTTTELSEHLVVNR